MNGRERRIWERLDQPPPQLAHERFRFPQCARDNNSVVSVRMVEMRGEKS